jgi:septal ring-binding cell division protein DamX
VAGTFQSVGAPTSERRCSPRQRVLFACIELDDDNGGLILDISERGLSVQAVATLAHGELSRMRFQLSPSQPGIETRGRIAWIGGSLKTAGVEFIGLPDEARDQIKQWICLELQANESVKQTMLGEMAPSKDEPENVIPFPESETIGPAENQNRHSIAGDALEVPPSPEKSFQRSRIKSATSSFAGNAPDTAAPRPSWFELTARLNRAHKQADAFVISGRLIALTVGSGLLLSVLFFLSGYHLRKTNYSQQHAEAISSAKATEPSTDNSANPMNSAVGAASPSHRAGFWLQVGAMRVKQNADALAEALQRRSFPVFVTPPGASRFYRVVVGPYSDADSTLRAQEELKEEGFEPIRTPWKP